jgi:neutral trehalase
MIAQATTQINTIGQSERQQLKQTAMRVLEGNWRNGFTVPSSNLYPFQWLWDSGFIALGWMHFDIDKARTEIKTLFDAQWDNGFLPHIIFHDDNAEKQYFPGAEFQGAYLNADAPDHVKTSGITQPPVLGFVIEELFNKEPDKTAQHDFYKQMVQKTYHFHHYLYNNRDFYGDGLVYIRHNWESGTDNSAAWDSIWASYTPPVYEVNRKDTQHVNQAQRPTKKDYNYYLHLIEVSKNCGYDEMKMREELPFIIIDPLFNSLLIASNQSLIRMANILGLHEIASQVKLWNEQTTKALNGKLFDEDLGLYGYFDLKNNRFVSIPTSSGLCPLFANEAISHERAALLKDTLLSSAFAQNDNTLLCPSLAFNHPAFEDRRYWRGPVWININWLLFKGCQKQGFNDIAERIKNDSLALVAKNGFYEYFSPLPTSEQAGFGGQDFSWSAALVLDMLAND